MAFKKLFKFASISVLSLVCLSSKIQATHNPQHIKDLDNLINNVTPNNTGYVPGGPTQVTWAGFNGATAYTCFTDSSGLLNALLNHTYGLSATDFQNWLGTPRPFAQNYVLAIAGSNRFHQIHNITEIKPGDILAIGYPPGVGDPGGDNGHILVVEEAPTRSEQKKPIVHDTQQWIVHIADCAVIGHGVKDTRYNGDGTFRMGVGRGTLRLYIDLHGNIVAYAWSRLEKNEYFMSTERPLVVGRLNF